MPRTEVSLRRSRTLVPAAENWGWGMQIARLGKYLGVVVFALALFTCGQLLAGVTASISGTVTDASGAVVAGATVTATNVETAVVTTQTTNAQGFYSFQSLPLGNYTIGVQQSGFKAYTQTGLVVDVNSALTVDVKLQVGATSEKVEVSTADASRGHREARRWAK